MKKLFILITMLLSSCTKTSITTDEITSFNSIYDYSDFVNRTINFEDIFTIDFDHEVYIFSKSCRHCENIKDLVLGYGFNKVDFFLLEFTSSIPVTSDISSTIGATSYETVSILGTPTLLVINSGLLEYNLAGENKIKDYIER